MMTRQKWKQNLAMQTKYQFYAYANSKIGEGSDFRYSRNVNVIKDGRRRNVGKSQMRNDTLLQILQNKKNIQRKTNHGSSAAIFFKLTIKI